MAKVTVHGSERTLTDLEITLSKKAQQFFGHEYFNSINDVSATESYDGKYTASQTFKEA